MAPAFYIPGYGVQDPQPCAEHTCVVFGWGDEVISAEHGIRFARAHKADLHLLDSDHRLNSVLPELGELFRVFLSHTAKTSS
jgi:hypothetical protein